jgi:hypothetical protein
VIARKEAEVNVNVKVKSMRPAVALAVRASLSLAPPALLTRYPWVRFIASVTASGCRTGRLVLLLDGCGPDDRTMATRPAPQRAISGSDC